MPQGHPCQVITIYNSKEQAVKYAKPGENVRLRLLHINDESIINKGDVLCNRDLPVPCTEIFEAEVEIHQLLSYKPIISKGYQFILHIHTVAEEAEFKELLVSHEKTDKGDTIEKQKPQFIMSHTRVLCRIATRFPICLEKYDTIEQMGRFTLRDEGMTIGSGKVLKYVPAKIIKEITQGAIAST